MRQIGKARKAKFLKDFAAILAKYGAKPIVEGPTYNYDATYSLETKAGTLNIQVDIDTIFTLFCRFANPTLAAEVAGFEKWPEKEPTAGEPRRFTYKPHGDKRLNPYSGKWNFHYRDADWTLIQFDQELQQFIAEQP